MSARIADLLCRVSSKGVRLWLENGQLRFRAPERAVTQVDLSELRQARDGIVSFLQEARRAGRPEQLEIVRRLNRAPLSFSQLQHWNFYRLAERPAMRHLAAAVRMRGHLQISALERSVTEVVRRHEALRTRIVVHEGQPLQEIDEPGNTRLSLHDLSWLREKQCETEIQRRIEQLILQPIDVSTGPLFEVALLRIAPDDHVLVVAIEHIVSDMWSLDLILREINAAYAQVAMGHTIALPPVPLQFPDFASWQRRHEHSWNEAHGSFWSQCLAGCGRLRFPTDEQAPAAGTAAWDMVPLALGTERTSRLNAWCQAKGTTAAICAFSTYALAVLRWCGVSDAVLRFETNGRITEKVEHTVGYFAAPLYLRMRLLERDSLADFLNRATAEFCAASDHADASYLEAQLPRPGYSRNPAFNWVPEASQSALASCLQSADSTLQCRALPFESPFLAKAGRDVEPFILFGADALSTLGHCVLPQSSADEHGGVVGGVFFPLQRFSIKSMQRFAASFLTLLDALISSPDRRVKDVDQTGGVPMTR